MNEMRQFEKKKTRENNIGFKCQKAWEINVN